MKISDFFYTQREAAEILDVNPITIWRYVRDEKFNAERIGRVVLIPKWEVELFGTKRKNARRKHK